MIARMTAPASPRSDRFFRDLVELRIGVDELIEEGLVKRWGVTLVIGAILSAITMRLGATGDFVQPHGEDLAMDLFV